ncbi:MAG: CvpA family protein [Bacteroidales bacterium]|nr:CvpA family protein [Bacteroidales bacterium]
MNYFDILIVIPLLWGAYKGFSKGLVIAVASLVALILGIYGAIKFSAYTGELVQNNFEIEDNYMPIISFSITFLAIVIGIHFIAKMLNKLVDAIALAWLNKIAGIVFGILKTAFIVSILIFIIETIDPNGQFIKEDYKTESLLYKPIKTIAPAIIPSLKEFHITQPSINSTISSYPI